MDNTWLQYAPTANKFKQTYVRGFMDISGNTIIRNGGLNIVNGNINIGTNLDVNANGHIKGNLTVDHTIYAGSIDISNSVSGPGLTVRQFANQPIATFYSDNAIMVSINDGGDVSMNRNLNVGGNLHLSGSSSAFGITKSMVGLGNIDNTSDANKPVSTAQQTALDLKATIASPTFTGTVAGITSTMVGLGNVDNTSDTNKPVSTAQQTALDLKSNLASPTFTGTVTVPATSITNTTVSTSTSSGALQIAGGVGIGGNLYVGGTTVGLTSTMVGLGNVDNTSDANKPVSIAQQTALDLKAAIASPTFTGTVAGITSTMVGLGNVTNTSDASKPVSTSQQTAIGLKADLASPTFTGLVTAQATSITNTTVSSSTSSGALQVAGGAGFGGAVYIGGGLNVAGTVTLPASCITSSNIVDGAIMNADISGNAAIAQSKIATLTTDLAAKIDTTTIQSITAGTKTFATGTTLSIASGATLSVAGTVTLPASCITSSNIVDDTIVDSDINASAAIAQSKIATLTTDLAAKAPLASPTFTGTLTTPATSITNTTISTSTSSGALQVAGGAGIGGNVYVGGNLNIGGDCNLCYNDSRHFLEIQSSSPANLLFMDFHCNTTYDRDYDARIIAYGTTANADATATLQLIANAVQVSYLSGNGTRAVYSTSSGSLTNSSSDVRLKTNIEPIDATQTHLKLLQLQPKTYQWIDTEKYGTDREIGLIAQEVIEHIPELVWTGNDGKYGLLYERIPTLLIQSIKELQRQIDELKAEMALLKTNPL